MPRPVAIPARLKAGPFTVAEALRAGIAWHVLDGPRFRRLFHGVYASVEFEPTLLLRCRAVQLLAPDAAVFSHRTAALLRGLPVADDQRIHLTVPPRLRGPQVKGIVVHRRALTKAEVQSVEPLDGGGDRWRITAPGRTFADLASELGLVDLVITGDAMVRADLATPRDLVEAIRPRVKGAASARRAARLVRPRVDSPMETRLRLLIVLAGLPCPEVVAPGEWPDHVSQLG